MQNFVKFKMAAAILDVAQNARYCYSPIVYVVQVVHFKFYRNRAINDRVMQGFVKFKMAAAAILDAEQNPAFTIF